jgi:hypothetical protein
MQPFEPLSKRDAAELTEEGHRLLSFAAADAMPHDIRLAGS